MKAATTRADAGAPIRDAKATVGEWVAHWRATSLAVSDRKQATKSLAPFGSTPLDRLRPSDIEGLLLTLTAKTKPGRPTADEPTIAASETDEKEIHATTQQLSGRYPNHFAQRVLTLTWSTHHAADPLRGEQSSQHVVVLQPHRYVPDHPRNVDVGRGPSAHPTHRHGMPVNGKTVATVLGATL
jgi:hypothetical protein